MKKKKRIVIGAAILAVVVILAVVAVILVIRNKRKVTPEIPQMPESVGDVISATGLTSVGMNMETLKLGFMSTELYVEESYLSVGDEVEAGTKVFKISDETLEEAKKELEDKVTETDLAYRQGVIDYQTDLLEAEQTRQKASTEATYAQTVYDQAVAEAKETVDQLQEQVDEARELLEEYQKSESEDYYRTYYQVDELYEAYYEHFQLLMSYYEKWDIKTLNDQCGQSASSLSLSSITSSSSTSAISSTGSIETTSGTTSSETSDSASAKDSGTAAQDGSGNSGNTGSAAPDGAPASGNTGTGTSGEMKGSEDGSESTSSSSAGQDASFAGFGGSAGDTGNGESVKLSVYNLLDELVTEEGEEYKEALENYENARDKAKAGLKKAESDLADLEEQLVTAQTEYETQLISCKADYDVTLSESENAELVYETTVQSLEETLESLKDDKEEAEDNQESFLEALSDGYFYTEKAGTVVGSGVSADSYLSGDVMVIAYSNPETVTITAQVDQADIADISIGEEAYVVVSGYGNYEGSVTTINPVTQADSRTSVSYQVTVTLSGDVSTLASNLTAYVYFGDVEAMKNAGSQSTQSQPGSEEGGSSEDATGGGDFTPPDMGNNGNGTNDGAGGVDFTSPDMGSSDNVGKESANEASNS